MLACRRTTFEWVVRRAALAEGTGDAARRRRRRRAAGRPTRGRQRPPAASPASASPTAPTIDRRPRRGRRRAAQRTVRSGSPPPARRSSTRRPRTPASSTSAASTGCVTGQDAPPRGGRDRRRPRLPQVRRVRRRQPHVLDHPGHAHRRRRAAQDARRSGRVRRLRRPARRRPAVARRTRRADHARGPRDGRAAQPLARARRRRPAGGHRRASPSATPCCAPTRSTAAAAARRSGAPICWPTRSTPIPTTSPRRRCAYDAALRIEIEPWYRASVAQDSEARRVAGASCSPARIPTPTRTTRRRSSAACCATASLPALRLDAVVLRAFMRSLNLLTTPDAMMTDPDVQSRVFAVWEDRDNRPPEEALGPKTRAELLGAIA